MESHNSRLATLIVGLGALALASQSALAVITVQIGGATRLSSLTRQRERYNCYWDCDLVGCAIARDDDECAYDCEKICRVKYDYAAGRSNSDAQAAASSANAALEAKTLAQEEPQAAGEAAAGESQEVKEGKQREAVRLYLPRNVNARNFAIWERCGPSANQTGQLNEKPFSL